MADLINIGIETLVRDRYELPPLTPWNVRPARSGPRRISVFRPGYSAWRCRPLAFRQSLRRRRLSARVSPWNDLKQDPAKPTRDGMRQLVARYDQLTAWQPYPRAEGDPAVKSGNGRSRAAAWMPQHGRPGTNKRYAVTLR